MRIKTHDLRLAKTLKPLANHPVFRQNRNALVKFIRIDLTWSIARKARLGKGIYHPMRHPSSWFWSLALIIGLLLPAVAHAATNVAIYNADLTAPTNWPGGVPLAGDTNLWQTRGSGAGAAITWPGAPTNFTFNGQTLEIVNGGSLTHSSASTSKYSINNMTLDAGGTLKHGANSQWNLSFNANGSVNTLQLNGGTISLSLSTGGSLIFSNVAVTGSGTVTITRTTNSVGFIDFSSATVDTHLFTGVFNVTGGGQTNATKLNLPAITDANESFELDLTDAKSQWTNVNNIAVTALKLWNTNSASLVTLAAGSYTASSLGSNYASCFSLPNDSTHTIHVGHSVTYDANGGLHPPATNWYNAANNPATLASVGSMTKAGFAFTGWNTSSGGTGTAYAAGASLSIATNITLYAQWTASATLTAPATFPAAIHTLVGTASSPTAVSIAGAGLSAAITATAPVGLEISSDNLTYGATAILSTNGGTLYARLSAAAAVGTYNSLQVILSSTGANPVPVATTLTGNFVVNPYGSFAAALLTSAGAWSSTGVVAQSNHGTQTNSNQNGQFSNWAGATFSANAESQNLDMQATATSVQQCYAGGYTYGYRSTALAALASDSTNQVAYLTANGNPVSASRISGPNNTGTFGSSDTNTITGCYAVGPGDPLIGQIIGLRLSSEGLQSRFHADGASGVSAILTTHAQLNGNGVIYSTAFMTNSTGGLVATDDVLDMSPNSSGGALQNGHWEINNTTLTRDWFTIGSSGDTFRAGTVYTITYTAQKTINQDAAQNALTVSLGSFSTNLTIGTSVRSYAFSVDADEAGLTGEDLRVMFQAATHTVTGFNQYRISGLEIAASAPLPSLDRIIDNLGWSTTGSIRSNGNAGQIPIPDAQGFAWDGHNADNTSSGSIWAVNNQFQLDAAANLSGSYVYTVFSTNGNGTATHQIDLSQNGATIKVFANTVAAGQKLRWLVRDAAGHWYLTKSATWQDTYPTDLYLSSSPIDLFQWLRVASTTEIALNQMNAGGALPLTTAGEASPDLARVTGFGIYVDSVSSAGGLNIQGVELHTYEALVATPVDLSTHYIHARNGVTMGFSKYGGGYSGYLQWTQSQAGTRNITGARFGRGEQIDLRSMYHSGRYNPTQAGFLDGMGRVSDLVQTNSSADARLDRVELKPQRMCMWNGDGGFDFCQYEDLTYGQPQSYLNANGHDADSDSLPEIGKTQADELLSEFELSEYTEDVSSLITNAAVTAIRGYYRADYKYLPDTLLQFNENATNLDGSPVLSPNNARAEIAPLIPGVQASNAQRPSSFLVEPVSTLDRQYANFCWAWYRNASNAAWTVVYLQDVDTPPATIAVADGQANLLMVADGSNQPCKAIAYYYPNYLPANQVSVVGINRQTGREVYADSRTTSKVISCLDRLNAAWLNDGIDPQGYTQNYDRMYMRKSILGILPYGDPALPTGAYERVEVDYFKLFGTPDDILAATPQLDAYYTNLNLRPVFSQEILQSDSVQYGNLFSRDVSSLASDPHGDHLSFSKVVGPDWVTVSTNGVLSGTPGFDDIGTSEVMVSVSDGELVNSLLVKIAVGLTSDPIYIATSNITLEAATTANWMPTPSTYPPTPGNVNTWQTGANTIINTNKTTVFYGNRFEITSGGTLQSGVAVDAPTFQNLQLDTNGTIVCANNAGFTINIGTVTNSSNAVFTLNGGTLNSRIGTISSGFLTFKNGSLAGSGTISVITGGNSPITPAAVTFASSVTLSGFTGTFSVGSNGLLVLPAISAPTFALAIPAGTNSGQWKNNVNLALTSLNLGGMAVPAGLYTPSNLVAAGYGAATNFTTFPDTTHTVQVGYAVSYNANGGTNPPATGYVSPGVNNATLATAAGMTYTGYVFTGWNTAAGGNGTASAAGASLTVSSNTTLYAQWTVASNTPPALNPITNRTLNAGQILTLTNTATDPNAPPQILTFSLFAWPTGMTVNAANGILTWRPTVAQAPSTNLVTMLVTDNGLPALSATQSFQVTVTAPAVTTLGGAAGWTNGGFSIQVNGSSGLDYYLQTTTNLNPPIAWLPLQTNASATPPFLFTDPGASNFNRRFYRVLLGP